MNLGLRSRHIGASIGVITYGVSLCRSFGVSAKAAGRYHLSVRCCACKSVILIAYRTDCRIAIRAMRIFLVLTCGILHISGCGSVACVLGRAVVAIVAFLHPLVLTFAVILPRAVVERTVRGAGGNRGTAVFTNGLPLTAGRPLFLRGGMRTIPERIQRHACICGISAARLILCTWHEFIRCPALEGIPRAAGGYRRQCQRDIFGFGLTARRTTASVCVIRHRIGCGCVFLPYRVKGTVGIRIIPFSRLISCASGSWRGIPPEKGISASCRLNGGDHQFQPMVLCL